MSPNESKTPSQRPLGEEGALNSGFLLEVTGQQMGLFLELSGLEMTVATEDHREGGVNGYVHKLPGQVTWANIVLKKGLTDDNSMLAWIQQSREGSFDPSRSTIKRTTAAITAVDYTGKRLRAWELLDVFPVRWSGPSLSATDSAPMTETLELAHHGFYGKTPSSG